VRLRAQLDDRLSPARWLVKWLLAVPHVAVYAGLMRDEYPPFRLDP
jgi:hypothetical protein